jgi:hypothetical protein
VPLTALLDEAVPPTIGDSGVPLVQPSTPPFLAFVSFPPVEPEREQR